MTASADDVRDAAAGFGQDAAERSCLVLRDNGWVLVDVDGTERATTGLEGGTVAAVAADPQGRTNTAVGWSTAESSDALADVARLWTSPDGIAWSQVPTTGVPAASRLTAVATSAEGAVLALGATLSREGHPQQLLSVVADSASGTTRAARVEVGGQLAGYPEAVAATGNGWAAAVVTAQGSTLQSSTDGRTWQALAGGLIAGVAVADLSATGADEMALTLAGNDVVDTQPVLADYVGGRLARRTPPVAAPAVARAVAPTTSGGRQSAWLQSDRLDVVTS